MIIADYVLIGLILIFAVVGGLLGFGKGLKILTKGIVGIAISAAVCYFLFGMVTSLAFVQNLMSEFVTFLKGKDTAFCNILVDIRIEIIAVAVILFVLVQIIRAIIVSIISRCAEAENVAVKVINKTLGIVLSLCVLAAIILIVMQISSLTIGWEESAIYLNTQGSFFKLDYIYLNNPMTKIFNQL